MAITVFVRQAADVGVQLMFCNTYHLLVHPGAEIIGKVLVLKDACFFFCFLRAHAFSCF